MAQVKIVVTSNSPIKKDAVQKAFTGFFPDHTVSIIPVKVQSEVSEQPFGHEETIRGALNRLENAKKDQQLEYDFIASVENGIFQVEISGQDHFYDIGWIVLEHKKGVRIITSSLAIEFPLEAIQAAQKEGFKTKTVGSVLAERFRCKEADPHAFLTAQFTDRETILTQAVEAALGQYFFQYRNGF